MNKWVKLIRAKKNSDNILNEIKGDLMYKLKESDIFNSTNINSDFIKKNIKNIVDEVIDELEEEFKEKKIDKYGLIFANLYKIAVDKGIIGDADSIEKIFPYSPEEYFDNETAQYIKEAKKKWLADAERYVPYGVSSLEKLFLELPGLENWWHDLAD